MEQCLKNEGLKVAALTNNWKPQPSEDMQLLRPLFDVFIESAEVGLRKPDREIYEVMQ